MNCLPELKTDFVPSTILPLTPLNFVFFTQLFFFVKSLYFRCSYFAFLVFKMGVKTFGLPMPILCFHYDALFLLLHDLSVFTAMPSFVVPRYFCLHHDVLLLLHHDISVCTTMPSFVTSRYFCVHRDAILCCFTVFLNSANSTMRFEALPVMIFKLCVTPDAILCSMPV